MSASPAIRGGRGRDKAKICELRRTLRVGKEDEDEAEDAEARMHRVQPPLDRLLQDGRHLADLRGWAFRSSRARSGVVEGREEDRREEGVAKGREGGEDSGQRSAPRFDAAVLSRRDAPNARCSCLPRRTSSALTRGTQSTSQEEDAQSQLVAVASENPLMRNALGKISARGATSVSDARPGSPPHRQPTQAATSEEREREW